MPRSRPSRISDAVRAELFAVIGKPDDGRVDRAIGLLIARYVDLSNSTTSPIVDPEVMAGFKAVMTPLFDPLSTSSLIQGEYDDEFS